ncbi:MAG: hypothetical protein WBP75_10445, partial [Candidatus Cybelea sp.]
AALRIEALLSRNSPGDAEAAERALAFAGDGERTIFPWNICFEVTRARVAVRLGRSDSDALLRTALDAVEERAHEIPFDADRAYAQSELACRAAGNGKLGTRAALQAAYYRGLRRAAAAEGRSNISVPIFATSRIGEPIGKGIV